MLNENNFIDSIMQTIMDGILVVLEFFVSIIFFNRVTAFLFWIIAINIVAIVIMKKDKQYAKEERLRIRESTLLIVAFAGGALGMYYAMYKYKHKTLHKKFTICVPFFIMLHFVCISYVMLSSLIV